jgi:hypothetical protein
VDVREYCTPGRHSQIVQPRFIYEGAGEPFCYRRHVSFRRLSVVVTFVAVSLLAASCGGDPRVNYQTDLTQVGATVTSALGRVPSDSTSEITPKQVHDLAGQLRSAASSLDGIGAPKGASMAQVQMVHGLDGVADAFDGLATKLDTAHTDEAKAELFVAFASDTKIDSAFNDISEAQAKYATAGFHMFATGQVPTAVTAR